MAHNLPDAPGRLRELPGHRVLALAGRDAATFAQAQFMGDVAALGDGQWQWNGWLTPKGRVVALFAVLRLDAEALWLLLPDADPASLGADLGRFVFRSKVRIEPRPDLRVAGALAAAATATGNVLAGGGDTALELDMGGDGGPRLLVVGPAARGEPDATFAGRWCHADLVHGLPRLDAAHSAQWTPQMLSLERLRAFSVRKGCYPGQEIVARTHFLGQGKRCLALLEADAPIASGAEVHDSERAIGTIVSSASEGDRHHALAVLPIARDPGSLHVDDQPVREATLRGGLAR